MSSWIDRSRNMKGVCGSFSKLVQAAEAMAAGDISEKQRLLTDMVLAGFKNNTHEPKPLFPLGFPKKRRSNASTPGNGNASSSSFCSDVLVCPNTLQDLQLKSGVNSDEQVLLAAMILADLKKPESAFPIGFPKRKRSVVSRGMGIIEKQKQRIILKFKPSKADNGTASYSFSVCYASTCNNVDVKPNPSVDDDDDHQHHKKGLVKLTMTSNKRCFSEIEEHGGLKGRYQKRVRNCGSQFLLHNTNNALCF